MSDKLKEAVRADAAEAPALAEAIKAQAATRASAVANVAPQDRAEHIAKNGLNTIIAPMFVIDGDADTLAAANAYEIAQEELRKQHEAMLAVKSEFMDAEYTFFIKCRYPHPAGAPQHGIYLKGYPHERIVKGTEWKSGYKPQMDAPWHGAQVLCQVCLRYLNREVPLDVTALPGKAGLPAGSFEINDRWLWKRPKDPKRLVIENETRVRRVGWETGNLGLDAAEERSKAAGLTVVSQ